MFRHLDDPVPFRPDDRFRSGAMRRGRQMRRHRRLAGPFGGVALSLVLLGGAGALYVERRDAAIDRTEVMTADSTDGAINILVVGSDVRSGRFEDPDVESARADNIVLVRLQPDGLVRVLPIPRDLVNPADGERINAQAGDPQALVDTISQVLGVPVDHYVQIGFEGFIAMVDEVGGLDVAVAVPLRDTNSGLLLEPSSCTTIDGVTALALVRARHVEGDPSGDFGRMARGQGVLAAAVAQLADEADDPAEIDRLSRILADHAVLDDGLSLARLVDLGRAVAAAGPEGVQAVGLPLLVDPDAGSVHLAPEAAAVLAQFGAPAGLNVTPPPAGAAPVRVPADLSTQIGPC